MTDSEKVACLLEEARELMNNKGQHWIKGSYHITIKEDGKEINKYCSLGAIEEIGSRKGYGHKISELANLTLAKSILASPKLKSRIEFSKPKKVELDDYGYIDEDDWFEDHVEDIITTNNDHHKTVWSEISGAFNRAAKRARRGL